MTFCTLPVTAFFISVLCIQDSPDGASRLRSKSFQQFETNLWYAFAGRVLFRLLLCFLFIYTPFVHTNASGVDSQGVQVYQLQWLACMPKFNLYANTGEPISKVVCLSTLQLLCCCDIYQCLKRLNFMRKVQNFEMRMSLKISESTIVL